MFSGFSREYVYVHYCIARNAAYSQVRLSPWICLRKSTSTPFNLLFRQKAVLSLLRPHVTPYDSNGILTVSAIGLAVRLNLRTRLTLIRLALISVDQETLVFRRGGFSPPLSLLIPTFAFPYAPEYLTIRLQRRMECSPTDIIYPIASVNGLYPIIIHAGFLD